MEKKTPAATQPVATEGKKDKNANPLLKNGVTNKDVISLTCNLNLDFQNSSLPFQN